jgi:hypothetical protein
MSRNLKTRSQGVKVNLQLSPSSKPQDTVSLDAGVSEMSHQKPRQATEPKVPKDRCIWAQSSGFSHSQTVFVKTGCCDLPDTALNFGK